MPSAFNYRGGVQNRARFGIKIPNVCAGFLAILHSAELGAECGPWIGTHGRQPAGLADGSRWSYPLPRTTTGKPRRMAEHSGGVPDPATMRFTPGPRAEAQKPVSDILIRGNWVSPPVAPLPP